MTSSVCRSLMMKSSSYQTRLPARRSTPLTSTLGRKVSNAPFSSQFSRIRRRAARISGQSANS